MIQAMFLVAVVFFALSILFEAEPIFSSMFYISIVVYHVGLTIISRIEKIEEGL